MHSYLIKKNLKKISRMTAIGTITASLLFNTVPVLGQLEPENSAEDNEAITPDQEQVTPTQEDNTPSYEQGEDSLIQTTQSSCDGEAVVGRFRRVGSGASFSFNGREVELQNESLLDTYSRAEIKSGWRSGDQVWVDRSYKRYDLTDSGIKSNADAESQGWKQCGPFSGKRTQSVNNSVHAARACARIDGVSKCGKWYLD
ncbi:hypothetical protein SAMD00079811_82360 (plasmid) [Scytonema sp. HK-05]|uniref:hypothetical protein n=2 Tax=Scytonema sp. HK-05 TaxID=1137095 RepID=UPI000936FB20|nr:hypothetical protein NIES2130_32180 [Scytonema sp. HK-05]BAY50607.1 hypothetical protein SAMD00079811_82360 [Scytonema sp. HK-05]